VKRSFPVLTIHPKRQNREKKNKEIIQRGGKALRIELPEKGGVINRNLRYNRCPLRGGGKNKRVEQHIKKWSPPKVGVSSKKKV